MYRGIILDFRLSPYFECLMFSFGLFSDVLSLIVNVSEDPVCSIFIGEWVRSVGAFEKYVLREQVTNRLWNKCVIHYSSQFVFKSVSTSIKNLTIVCGLSCKLFPFLRF
jgi:hypothetical protein